MQIIINLVPYYLDVYRAMRKTIFNHFDSSGFKNSFGLRQIVELKNVPLLHKPNGINAPSFGMLGPQSLTKHA